MACRRLRDEVRQQVRTRREQVAVGLLVAAAHASAQLVQVAEAEVLRLVHDDRVRVRDVEAVLHDGGADEHIGVAFDEVHHHLFQLVAFELSVTHTHARTGHQLADHVGDELDVLHLVVEEVHLATA